MSFQVLKICLKILFYGNRKNRNQKLQKTKMVDMTATIQNGGMNSPLICCNHGYKKTLAERSNPGLCG